MTHFFYKRIFLISIVCIIMQYALMGCDEKDHYDPGYQTENPIEGVEVSAGFDWKTTLGVDLKVVVNDEYNGEYYYLIEVFTENPVGDSNLKPIAIGFANENQMYATRVTLPKSVENLYIRQTDPRKRSATRSYSVSESIHVNFKPVVSRAASVDAMVRALEVSPPKYVEEYPEDAIVVDPGNPGLAGNGENYVINEDFTGTLNFSKPGKLFIAPYVTLKVSSLTIPASLEVIVLKGASLTMEDAQLSLQGKLFIASEARCKIKDVTTSTNVSTIENWGYLDMQNYTPNDNILLNYYYVSCKQANIQSGTDFHNYCHFYAEDWIRVNQTDIHLYNGYFMSKSVRFDTSKIYLNDASMIEAGTGNLDLLNSDFYGLGEARSLIKAPKITFNQGNSTHSSYNGILTIEGVQDSKKGATVGGKPTDAVELVVYGESTVDIGVCTGVVNPVYPGKEPDEEDGGSIIIQTNDGQYTYMFEDQWPFYGDYDMNDIVFKISNITTHQNKQNQAVKLKFNFTLQAVGAQKRIAGAVMFDRVDATSFKSVQYTNNAPVYFETSTSGVETGQTKAVLPLFDEAHTAMGLPKVWYINSINDSKDNTDYLSYTVEIDFSAPVPVADLNIDYFNFFIITDVDWLTSPSSSNRREIHLRGYKATTKANTDFYGNNNDNSNQILYTSKDNLVWGLMIPDAYRWPAETVDIQDAYPDFKDWIISGDNTNASEWWKNPVESNLYVR